MTRVRWAAPVGCALGWAWLTWSVGASSNGGGVVALGYFDTLQLLYAGASVGLAALTLGALRLHSLRWLTGVLCGALCCLVAWLTWRYTHYRDVNALGFSALVLGAAANTRRAP